MLAVLSPARNVRLDTPGFLEPTAPLFPKQTAAIVRALRELAPHELESLLDLPAEAAFTMYDNYRRFNKLPGGCALASYYGAAFRNMELGDFTAADYAFAQSSLRILSALYGAARPLDEIRPHRLPLKRNFKVGGQDLYALWGRDIYRALFQSGEVVVNLASLDYSKLFEPYLGPGDRVVSCKFQIQRPGAKPRGTVSTVRAARGRMARFIVKNRVSDPAALKAFSDDGYQFSAALSSERQYVFIKDLSFG